MVPLDGRDHGVQVDPELGQRLRLRLAEPASAVLRGGEVGDRAVVDAEVDEDAGPARPL